MRFDAAEQLRRSDTSANEEGSLKNSRSITGAVGRFGLALLVAGVFSACDFDVTNPGPVQDDFLNESEAFNAMVNGMGRALAEGMNYTAFHGAAVTRELHPTGGTGQFGLGVSEYNGRLDPDEQSTPWNLLQQSRWTAEDGLRRFAEVLDESAFNSSAAVARAYLWAGYANRSLGENMCEAVIDGGSAQSNEVFLTRAEEHFSNAIDVGGAAGLGDVVTAGYAGRAAVRVHLGDWAGAVQDAGQVPEGFIHHLQYFDDPSDNGAQRNRIAYASNGDNFKTNTVWGTVYEEYYPEWNDPRVAWVDTGILGDGAVECCGSVPFYQQRKYPEAGSDMPLSDWREMRLIEAEALLRDGSWQAAMDIVNDVRASVGVDPRETSSLEEAWTHLKRERGVELWLEGRRLGDLRRWEANGTPGALDAREVPGSESHMQTQDLCFPIPDSELETNPNLSIGSGSSE